MGYPSEHLLPTQCEYVLAELYAEAFALVQLSAAIALEEFFQCSGMVLKWVRFPAFWM